MQVYSRPPKADSHPGAVLAPIVAEKDKCCRMTLRVLFEEAGLSFLLKRNPAVMV